MDLTELGELQVKGPRVSVASTDGGSGCISLHCCSAHVQCKRQLLAVCISVDAMQRNVNITASLRVSE